MHKDTFRSKIPTKKYKDNHEAIFGKATGAPKLTKAQKEAQERSRKDSHARDAAAGKKDADYYLQNEQRVSADPNYQKKPTVNENYRKNYEKLYGK